jgi:hypothetical protein
MDFFKLPSVAMQIILSYTSDLTVFNMCLVNKSVSQYLNNIKQDVLWKRYDKDAEYAMYDIYNTYKKTKQERNCCTIEDDPLHHMVPNTHVEDVYTFTSRKKITSMLMITRLSLQNDNVCDILTSIKIKGVLERFTLDFSKHTIIPEIGQLLNIGMFAKDADGFYEVLTPFITCLPLFCMNFFEPYMNLTSKGNVSIKMAKCCVSKKFLELNGWNNIIMLSQMGQPCRLKKMVPEVISTMHYLNVLQLSTTFVCTEMIKGLCIIIKEEEETFIHYNDIKTFQVRFDEIPDLLVFPARRIHINFIKKYSDTYNLSFAGQNYYYIPLETLSLEEGSRGTLQISMATKFPCLYVDIVQWSEELHSFYTGWSEEHE